MRWKQSLGTMNEMLTIVAVTLVLASSALGQVKNTTLYAFAGGADGSTPSAVVFDGAGNLYGTTPRGANGYGNVFELTPNLQGTWTKSVLYEFTGGDDGAYPLVGLVFDQAGNLYGTAEGGGNSSFCDVGSLPGCGVVFELMPNSNGIWTESVVHQFSGGDDGAFPSASLTFDGAGNLYGTTDGGGTRIFGVAFKLSPSNGGWTETVLYDFGARRGQAGSLTVDPAGNLYGTNSAFGSSGEAFQLTPTLTGNWNYHVMHLFTGGMDGAHPQPGLIFDSGNLYGTTGSGGANGYGNVFKLTPRLHGGWNEHVLHQFRGGRQGAQPAAGLTRDMAGNLYGTTYDGGNLSNCSGGCGVAFKLTPTSSGWKESVLARFGNHPGAHPAAGFVLDTAGNLYGTSAGDGMTTFGSVFVIAP